MISKQLGYFNRRSGWISPDFGTNEKMDKIEAALTEVVNNFDVNENHITIGNTGGAGSSLLIKSENLSIGRYIYMNSQNEYADTDMDSGLIFNVEVSPNLSFNVDGYGFTGTKVHVDMAVGLLPTQFLAVQSELNTGIYEVVTHIGNEITINSDPQEPFCKSEFNDESANGTVRAIKVSVIRGVSDTDDTIEEAKGQFAPLSYHKVLYDSKASGQLGNIELTDESDQVKLSKTTISAEGLTERTHSIKDTADDEFTMNDATQTLKNKTMTDNTNNVISRGLWVTNGTGSVSTYAATAPSSGQVLKATASTTATWQTINEINLRPGNLINLNGGKSDQNNGTITIAVDNQTEQDPEEVDDTLQGTDPPTNPDFPGADLPNLPGMPGVPGLPGIPIVAAFGGAVAAAGFAGAVGAFGAVIAVGIPGSTGGIYTDQIRGHSGASGPYFPDGLIVNNIYSGTTGPVQFPNGLNVDPLYYDNAYEKTSGHGMIHWNDVRVKGNCYLENNVAITGTLTTINTEQINTRDRYIFMNSGYSPASAQPGGVISNILPIDPTYILSGNFDEGIYTFSDSSVGITGSTGLLENDIIIIGGSQNNDGVYCVHGHTGNVLSVKGQLSALTVAFAQRKFNNEGVTGTVYAKKVNIAGLEFNSTMDGMMYVRGNQSDNITRNAIAYDTSSPSFSTLSLTGLTGTSADTLLVLDSNTVKTRSVSSLASSLASSFTSTDLSIGYTVSSYPNNSGSTYANVTVRTDPIRGDITCVRLEPFSMYITAAESRILLSVGTFALPSKILVFPILLHWDSNHEQCLCISDPANSGYRIVRANGDNFPAGSTISHATQAIGGITAEYSEFVYVKF